MIQTKSERLLPDLGPAQRTDLAWLIANREAAGLPTECRVHPDDWDQVRSLFPPTRGSLPSTPDGIASLKLYVGIGSAGSRLTQVLIVLDVDAPRLQRIDVRQPSIGAQP